MNTKIEAVEKSIGGIFETPDGAKAWAREHEINIWDDDNLKSDIYETLWEIAYYEDEEYPKMFKNNKYREVTDKYLKDLSEAIGERVGCAR